ncbi:MAG: DUF2911 domain-containing protein [Phycisphaerae bacterium]|nr:DUF2911 domain-containing protein [Phycisphaerae bacterium]MBN8597895.1 DUF2911 domain-containing protein [Planctomycetota bacterium]
MKLWKPVVSVLAISAVATLPLMAQPAGSAPAPAVAKPTPKRASPGEVTSTVIDGNRVTLVYSRPGVNDPKTGQARKIWGGLVPYGSVWRAGANEASMLITQQPIDIGGTTVPAGAYTVFMLPVENGTSKLILNKQLGQWGSQYDEKQDLARIDLKQSAPAAPVEQFTMTVAKESTGGGTLTLAWDTQQFTVPYSVKK